MSKILEFQKLTTTAIFNDPEELMMSSASGICPTGNANGFDDSGLQLE